jgi:hypothetical protein
MIRNFGGVSLPKRPFGIVTSRCEINTEMYRRTTVYGVWR